MVKQEVGSGTTRPSSGRTHEPLNENIEGFEAGQTSVSSTTTRLVAVGQRSGSQDGAG